MTDHSESPLDAPALPAGASVHAGEDFGPSVWRSRIVLAVLSLVVVLIALASVAAGAADISMGRVVSILVGALGLPGAVADDSVQGAILLQIRLPRVVLGLIAGGVLGLTGAVIQGLFRNPLAEPSLIGISSGAALAVVALTVAGGSVAGQVAGGMGPVFMQQAAAFAGGLVVALLVWRFARSGSSTRVSLLLLAGIAFTALANSLMGLFIYIANDAQLRAITFWMLGSLGGANWESLRALALVAIPVMFALSLNGSALNALALGEAEAHHLGINIERLKRGLVIWVALGVGGVVALCGVIGFVGLVVPHLVRLAIGPDHRLLLPASALLGAALLTLADLASRVLIAPQELPIGIVTALIGAPFFLGLILRERNRGWLV